MKEITYKQKYILFLTEQEFSGPWFSFKIKGKKIGTVPVVLKNIEPTPIYKLVNSKKGTFIDRITLDFDVNEYLKKLIAVKKLKPMKFKEDNSIVRSYIDIFLKPKVPFLNAFITLKNISDYDLIDLSMYFVFDFDINGLEGFDDDFSGYDEENDIIYQYDKTGLHAGFSPISKPTYYESSLTRNFKINNERLNLSNKLYDGHGEILSALQIDFKTLEPNHSFQTALVLTGGLNKEELFENIKEGKTNAMKYLSQVNRSVKSEQRNLQEPGFIKLNLKQGKGCH